MRLFRRAVPTPSLPVAVSFDEDAYLTANPDVRAAVASGQIRSGHAHWEAFGRSEGRALALRVAYTREELAAEIEGLRELLSTSLSAWLRGRDGFTFYEDMASLPADPLSPEYRARQLALYCDISGASHYDPWDAEPTRIVLADTVDPAPYPFNSRDGELIGGHLREIGALFQTLWRALPGTDRTLLEYGCGSGMTTVLLAAAGYRVTAIDINEDALAVVNALASGRKLAVRTHCGRFGDVPDEGTRFEVILFYEAFHHCLDFVALLETLQSRLAPGGVLVLAGEPVFTDFPKPWGLRVNAAALWEVYTRGWLELGFREDFFRDVLARTGWSCEKVETPGVPPVFVARSTR